MYGQECMFCCVGYDVTMNVLSLLDVRIFCLYASSKLSMDYQC